MLLHEILSRWARARPHDPALVFDDVVTTFAQLEARVARLADALTRVAQPGPHGDTRVAIVGENAPEWVDAYYGVPRAGQVLAFVNHRLSTDQIRSTIRSARPTVLIAGQAQLDALRVGDDDHPPLAPHVVSLGRPGPGEWSYDAFLTAHRPLPSSSSSPPPPAGTSVAEPAVPGRGSADDTAWLITTSGTSGTPKFVELSHANLFAAVRATTAVRAIGPSDRYLFPFPLCHVAGYNIVMFHAVGRPVVLLPRFEAATFVAQVARHAVTTASLAPTMIHTLTDHLDETGGDIEPLRSITYGSSAIAPSLLARAMARLGTDFSQGYGMTELSGNAVFLSPADHLRGITEAPWLLRAAGRPSPHIEIRLVDDDGHPVAPGEVGEVAVRGDQVMKGYWEAPEANAAAFVDGWFHTGDIGRFDEGYLSIVDRKKDIIVTGGENVSSREVEDHLVLHPGVSEAAVVGLPDPQWGEVVCAVVVPRPGAIVTEADVLAHGRATIGGYKQPRRALVVEVLPRNASGKVLKTELRDLVAETFLPT